ncbi:hypothetical protein FEM48_Zijuj08G0169400 [Ziziphus jujuba var. spinosa]|uniref:Uncharacterized protein n=1 Tax=Ziziphus jujuba var. spinosa TaxID=714518 RepID=A0A978V0A0_ZIZJJ|nr:hypothetical protein FEM48_Zijuj08G0169400 [Ziziphus jujuba var. spinosa]
MGHTYPVNQIIRFEGDKADPPKHLGYFCPALFRSFQPLSLSHKVASAGPFADSVRDLAGSLATSFRFETLGKEEIVEFVGVGGFELRKIIYYSSLQ